MHTELCASQGPVIVPWPVWGRAGPVVSCRCGFGPGSVPDTKEAPVPLRVSGLPVSVVRRRATLPHPVGCSTIAVPGLSFRVRNGTGRLTWAMAAANLLLCDSGKTPWPVSWRLGNRIGDAISSIVVATASAYCRLVSIRRRSDASQP